MLEEPAENHYTLEIFTPRFPGLMVANYIDDKARVPERMYAPPKVRLTGKPVVTHDGDPGPFRA